MSWTPRFGQWSKVEGSVRMGVETMSRTRKIYPASLKARVAVEAIKGHRTTTGIAKIYGVYPNLIGGWKKQALQGLPQVFENGRDARQLATEAEKDDLYRQIGRLQVELEFVKKKSGLLG